MKQDYETICILSGTLTEDEYKNVVNLLLNKLKSLSATESTSTIVTSTEMAGKKKLAYYMHGESEGWYVTFQYNTNSSLIPTWDRILRINEHVLKFMTVKLSEDEEDYSNENKKHKEPIDVFNLIFNI